MFVYPVLRASKKSEEMMDNQLSILELQKAFQERTQALKELVDKRTAILKQLDVVDTTIETQFKISVKTAMELVGSTDVSDMTSVEAAVAEVQRDLLALEESKKPQPGSLTEYVVNVLADNPGGLTSTQIRELVLERGYKSNAKKVANNINVALAKIRGRGEIRYDKKKRLYYPKR